MSQKTINQIAIELGRSYFAVRHILDSEDIKPVGKKGRLLYYSEKAVETCRRIFEERDRLSATKDDAAARAKLIENDWAALARDVASVLGLARAIEQVRTEMVGRTDTLGGQVGQLGVKHFDHEERIAALEQTVDRQGRIIDILSKKLSEIK